MAGMQLGSRTSDEDYVSLLQSMKKRPIDYFRNFYADTALFGGIGRHQDAVSISSASIMPCSPPTCPSSRRPASTFAKPSAASKAWTSAPPTKTRSTEGNARRLLKHGDQGAKS